MNQKTSFMFAAIVAATMMMATAGTAAQAQQVSAGAGAAMTLEQLLLWIQQYNLAHPGNPIVLDMNTILSAPPQQIKTVIETHINTETHDNDDGNGQHHNHHDHKKFNWNGLFGRDSDGDDNGGNNGGNDHASFRSTPGGLLVPDGSHGTVDTRTPVPTAVHDDDDDDGDSKGGDSLGDVETEGSGSSGSSGQSDSGDGDNSGSGGSSDSSDSGGDSGGSDGGGSGDSGSSSN